MLSPDELIKALKSCAKSDCDSCPLKGYESYDECTAALAADALGHIGVIERGSRALNEIKKQLAAELAKEKERNQYVVDGALTLTDEAIKFKRERDFLLKYLTDSHWAACDICKHEPGSHDINDCMRIRQVGVPCFEWRGLPEDDHGR